MYSFLHKQLSNYKRWRKEALSFSFFDFLLIAVVLGLIVFAIAACTTSTKGPLSIKALKDYLQALQLKFSAPLAIDAEEERAELEKLLIDVKSSCHQQVISSNTELKSMFHTTRKQIKTVTESREVANKSSWQKLKDVTTGFDEFYFPNVG